MTATRPPATAAEVEAAVAEHVRPYLRNHGGDIRIEAVTGGSVRVRLEGACRGCPAAPVTVLGVLAPAIARHVDPNLAVSSPDVAVSDAAARRIRSLFPRPRRAG